MQAIISLDGTSTASIGEDMPAYVKPLLGVTKFQQATGFTSILAILLTNKKNLLSLGYTEKELNDLIVYAGFPINDTLLEQMLHGNDFIKDVNELPYPDTVPYFKIISKQTYETKNKQLPITPQEYQQQHRARIGDQAQFEILDGTHFIYLNNVERI